MPPRRLMEDGFCLLCSNSKSNAGHEPCPEAGAQRTLEGIGSMPWLGDDVVASWDDRSHRLINHLHLFFIHTATMHFDLREIRFELMNVRRR
jgi:hypothetical protein